MVSCLMSKSNTVEKCRFIDYLHAISRISELELKETIMKRKLTIPS